MTVKKAKVLVLMSGGLDSMLAARILSGLGADVVLICFESYFFSCAQAKKSAGELGMALRTVDISREQLDMVKKPKYGRGKAINPCIDCHLLMLETAKEIMEREGFDLVATGEVLEERPLSQNKRALDLIEKKAGLEGRLLRPLSARLLPETEAERIGLIDRSGLYSISGRSRKIQLELAGKFGFSHIPQPGGGCILTEKDYAEKLAELMEKNKDFDGSDAKLLRCGRVFWEGRTLFVIARKMAECLALKSLAKKGDYLVEPENFSGPSVLIRNFDYKKNKKTEMIISAGKEYILKYSKNIPSNPVFSVVRK